MTHNSWKYLKPWNFQRIKKSLLFTEISFYDLFLAENTIFVNVSIESLGLVWYAGSERGGGGGWRL